MRGRHWLAALLLAGATLGLYSWRLGEAPIFPSPDEVIIAVDAHALATTGRDVEGTFLPLYFHVQVPGDSREGWFTPAIFYAEALFLKLLPLSVRAIRLPTACIGVVDVVLMYFLGWQLFGNRWLAAFAAALLALTPAHMILSRYGLDYLYPLPFVIGWLLCLAHYEARRQPAMLAAAAACLGFGFYSYIGAVVMMPLYALLTAFVLWRAGSGPSRYGLAAAAFVAPLLAVVPWLLTHPSAIGDTVQRYDLYDPAKLNALQGLRSFLSFGNVDDLVSRYWSFFNPSFLFLSGDHQMMFSTRLAGVFLLPVAVLLVFGFRHLLMAPSTPLAPIVLAGFITGPVAAVLVPEAGAINRSVEIIPFTILLATFGLMNLWSDRTLTAPRGPLFVAGALAATTGVAYGVRTLATQGRVSGATALLIMGGAALLAGAALSPRFKLGPLVAGGLLVVLPLQFAVFAHDYFNDYRLRSAHWLGGNLPGALEFLIDRAHSQQAPAIYFATLRATGGLLDIRNRWMDPYWKFYLIKNGRQELLARSARFDGTGIERMPAGSLVLGNVGDVTTDMLIRTGGLKPVERIREVDHSNFFIVLQR